MQDKQGVYATNFDSVTFAAHLMAGKISASKSLAECYFPSSHVIKYTKGQNKQLPNNWMWIWSRVHPDGTFPGMPPKSMMKLETSLVPTLTCKILCLEKQWKKEE